MSTYFLTCVRNIQTFCVASTSKVWRDAQKLRSGFFGVPLTGLRGHPQNCWIDSLCHLLVYLKKKAKFVILKHFLPKGAFINDVTQIWRCWTTSFVTLLCFKPGVPNHRDASRYRDLRKVQVGPEKIWINKPGLSLLLYCWTCLGNTQHIVVQTISFGLRPNH